MSISNGVWDESLESCNQNIGDQVRLHGLREID